MRTPELPAAAPLPEVMGRPAQSCGPPYPSTLFLSPAPSPTSTVQPSTSQATEQNPRGTKRGRSSPQDIAQAPLIQTACSPRAKRRNKGRPHVREEELDQESVTEGDLTHDQDGLGILRARLDRWEDPVSKIAELKGDLAHIDARLNRGPLKVIYELVNTYGVQERWRERLVN